MEIGSEKLRDEIAIGQSVWPQQTRRRGRVYSHILERRDEDIAEGDDLWANQRLASGMVSNIVLLTFSCLRCLRSFSSRYVRFARTGVLKGFMIFLMATFWFVS